MPPAQPPCVTYDPSIHRLNFDFVQCKIVTNNLGGLGYDNKAWVGPPVIRYASVAIGDLKLRTQELLDLFPMDGDRARTIGEFVHYRFDLVLSNLTKYTQNTNRYNGKAKGTFGSVNLKSGFETKFELKLVDKGSSAGNWKVTLGIDKSKALEHKGTLAQISCLLDAATANRLRAHTIPAIPATVSANPSPSPSPNPNLAYQVLPAQLPPAQLAHTQLEPERGHARRHAPLRAPNPKPEPEPEP